MYINSSGLSVSGAAANLDVGRGYYIQSNHGGTFTGLSAYDCTTDGFYLVSNNGASFTSLAAYSCTSSGFNVASGEHNTFVSITAYDNGAYGIISAGGDYCTWTGINTYSNGSWGAYWTTTVDNTIVTSLMGNANTNYGVYLSNGSRTSAIRGGYNRLSTGSGFGANIGTSWWNHGWSDM
jgi:hypothetical protein